MNFVLNDVEARVLGALVEKDITTPDYYPLSLNALVNACNQKNNREPVMSLDESAVREALSRLHDQGLAGPASGADSRVPNTSTACRKSSISHGARLRFYASCCCGDRKHRASCAAGRSACIVSRIWTRCSPVCST